MSDLLYFQTMSGILTKKGREGLSDSWTITPVGGSDKVPTFVALLGSQKGLNIAVLIDYQKKDKQSIEGLYKKKLLKKKKVLTFADFTNTQEADVEDMFERNFYLQLVNEEFKPSLAKTITASDLDPSLPRVLTCLEKYFETNPMTDATFSHYRPARYFAEASSSLSELVSSATVDRFEEGFKALNKLIK